MSDTQVDVGVDIPVTGDNAGKGLYALLFLAAGTTLIIVSR